MTNQKMTRSTIRARLLQLAASLVALLVFAAPETAHAQSHGGNPGIVISMVRPAGSPWTVTSSSATSVYAAVQSCTAGTWESLTSATSSVGVGAFSPPSNGSWCAVQVQVNGLTFVADGPEGRQVTLPSADVTTVVVFDKAEVVASGSTPWVLELGNVWIEQATVYLDPQEHRTFPTTGPVLDAIVDELEKAEVFDDIDDDGVISAAEREGGPIGS